MQDLSQSISQLNADLLQSSLSDSLIDQGHLHSEQSCSQVFEESSGGDLEIELVAKDAPKFSKLSILVKPVMDTIVEEAFEEG